MSRNRSFRHAVIPFVLVVGALACRDSITEPPPAPASIAGRYALESLRGGPLPAEVIDDGLIRAHLMADTLVIGDDGAGTWRTSIDFTIGDGSLQTIVFETAVTVRRVEQAFILSVHIPCPEGQVCEQPDDVLVHALADGDIRFQARYGEHRFGRVNEPD